MNWEITIPYPDKMMGFNGISDYADLFFCCSAKLNVSTKMFLFFIVIFVSDYCAGYKIIKKIGEGTFSEVLKTQSLKDGKFYACKTMKQTINRYASCNTFSCAPQTISGAFEPNSAVCGPLKLESAA